MEGMSSSRLSASVEEQLDDSAASLAPSAIARDLQEKLGQQVASRLVGLGDSRQLGRYCKRGGPRPRPVIELRLREAYKLVGIIAAAFNEKVAKSWLLGTNSKLQYRAPIDVFREAETAEQFIPARLAALQFVLSQATVRDPLADTEAVRVARSRPMSERLQVALSWNLMASELRAGMERQESSG